MKKHTLTCVECPMGCSIEVVTEEKKAVLITGNNCPRGKAYAENEVVCPMRVVTSTVRGIEDKLIPVKTDKPVKKSNIFVVMKAINSCKVDRKVKIGDVLIENISDGANLVVSGNVY